MKCRSYTLTCSTSVCSSPAERLCSSDSTRPTFLTVSQCLYCHSVIQSDNSITVNDFPPELSPEDNFLRFNKRDRGEVNTPVSSHFPVGSDCFVSLYIGQTVSGTTAVSKICHQLLSIIEESHHRGKSANQTVAGAARCLVSVDQSSQSLCISPTIIPLHGKQTLRLVFISLNHSQLSWESLQNSVPPKQIKTFIKTTDSLQRKRPRNSKRRMLTV